MPNNIKFFIFLLFIIFTSPILASSTITITNGDATNSGFNDQSAITPAGGNKATTLGQARLNAIQYAVNQLSIRLNSTVNIDVFAFFQALGGTPTRTALAGATASDYKVNFTGAPIANTYYHVALAEKISGKNLNANLALNLRYDLLIRINSDIDGTVVLGTRRWYYGFDSKPPVGDIDFVAVVTHELLHGLGFSTPARLDLGTKVGPGNFNDTYLLNLERHGALIPNFALMSGAQLASAGISNNVHWVGAGVIAAAAANVNRNPGFQNGHAAINAPNPYKRGSSISHFSRAFFPNEMMEPAYKSPTHDIGLAAQVLADVGWGKLNTNPNTIDMSIAVSNQNLNPLQGANEMYSVTVTNNGAQTATGIIISNFLPANSKLVLVNPANGATCDSTNVTTNRIVSCSLASLPASGSAIFNVLVTLNNSGKNEFSANVESLNPDSTWANNNAVNKVAPIAPGIQSAPVLFVVNDVTVEAGQTVNLKLTAVDSNGFIPAISILSLPAGSTFIPNRDGTATFSWATTVSDIGMRKLVFKATDGDLKSTLSDTMSVNITVKTKSVPAPITSSPTTPAKSNNNIGTGGCSLNQSAKFDPVFPTLLLFFIFLYYIRKYKLQKFRKAVERMKIR